MYSKRRFREHLIGECIQVNKKRIDITENIASGEIDHIISVLKRFQESGFDRLYWDGYDSTIHLYKSSEAESCKTHEKNSTKINNLTTCRELPHELAKALNEHFKKWLLS